MSILALGIMPYISASIIMQLMTAVSPQLEQLKKEGELGDAKSASTPVTARYCWLWFRELRYDCWPGKPGCRVQHGLPDFYFVAVSTFVTGAVFMMWLGEQITERGIGNGISLLIFAGIVAGLPGAIGKRSNLPVRVTSNHRFCCYRYSVLAVATVAFVVFIERGQRRITVNYAKRQQGRKMFAGQSSHLPLKVNMAGVIPAIFASSILLFPASIGQWFGQGEAWDGCSVH